MANLYRLIALVLALWSGHAAAFPASYVRSYCATTGGCSTLGHPAGAQAACNTAYRIVNGLDSSATPNPLNANPFTSCKFSPSGGSVALTSAMVYICPANATLSGSTCTCNSGFTESNGTCVAYVDEVTSYCNQTADSPVVDYAYRTTTPSLGSKSVCSESVYAGQAKGCADQVEVTFCAGSSSGVYTCYGSGKRTGGTCTLSTQPESTTSTTSLTPTVWPEAPPKGKCPGQVNGVDVLVDCATTSSSSTLTGTTTTGSGTSAISVTAGTTTNTVCSGGLCTVSVVVSGPAGTSQVNVTSGTQSQICANSSAEACQGSEDSSSFGGSCAAGFSCDGDAVQCAMAKEQHTKNCQLFEGTSPERSLYEAAKSSTTAGFNSSTTAITPGSFDTTNALGAGSCIADLNVVVWGSTIELPFSQVCDSLQYLRAVLLAVSFLIALRIVTRG